MARSFRYFRDSKFFVLIIDKGIAWDIDEPQNAKRAPKI